MSETLRNRIVSMWSVAVLAIAFGLNFVWEMAQAYLYEPMGSVWEATRRCLVAALGDGVLVLIVLVSTLALAGRMSAERHYSVCIALAVVMAIAVEWWGLSQGRWAYESEMPRVPGTAIGIAPVLQMAILTPVTMWLAGRTARRG